MVSEDARRHVSRHERRLGQERPRAAHRIEEDTAVIPPGTHQDPRRKHLADRRRSLRHPVAPLMERLAGGVECQRHRRICDMDVEAHIRIHHRYIGTTVGTLTEEV